MSSLFRNIAAAFALGLVIGGPVAAVSAKSSDDRTFTGAVSAVSRTNLKVHSVEGGKTQTISFDYAPNKRIMMKVHMGEQVIVHFNQKLLGIRRLTAVYAASNPNVVLGP